MLISCWSVKGGVGTTVVAVGLALTLGHTDDRPALLVDLAGDVPATLGLAEPGGPGLADWLTAGPGTPPDALARLETPVTPGLTLLHRGRGPLCSERAGVLLQLLAASGRPVVVDCGRIGAGGLADRVAAEAGRSLLVSRPCIVGLRRARCAPVRPSGVVLVRDPGRSITSAEVERCTGAPVVADLAVDPAVARAVDAGLLVSRMPRKFRETLRAAA